MRSVSSVAVVFVLSVSGILADDQKSALRERAFRFSYVATVTGLKTGTTARVWVPVPSTTPAQVVTIVAKSLPEDGQIMRDKQYGNRILYFEAPADSAGKIAFHMEYDVVRREVRTDGAAGTFIKPGVNEKLRRFLEPDAKVPIDGKPLDLIKDKNVPAGQLAAARLFYDTVNRHMRYSKEGKGWGQGDAVWACDSKYGNCSDFHSLFIALARAHKIPSKFEIGFPLPSERGLGKLAGYHCWAWFLPDGKGWVPVDISEANRHPKLAQFYFGNLTEDRVAFSVGRDIELTPRQAGGPLNFFIYPHVEVDGRSLPSSQLSMSFRYRDLAK